ncbi:MULTISPECIES: septation ring formation regulator EzrA [unclassified Sporosarcina]|uniref:septation ring formation regulator EzrA n=1 Tax=unclassified Sporosarcina TaxID=2647733 RepID=UPI00203F4DC5|nr:MULTISPECIES: septation ring formation regulator EzrA [unclassified Sporosarcina]GKV64796.1 septation ring formation regulator EzrA [Sporosarcina sp. NCCP-2331]GLB54906.1 septation ring formation regulator EzrA [Sporosarcina sp. NCCP-2378]
MKYFIIPLIIVIVLTVIAFLFRRKHIQEIGKLEQEKLQIQHKPIFEEMTKVKQLNMTGQTEEKFERWRSTWTEVIDDRIPKVDSLLFDVEDQVDRFHFKKATETEKHIQEILSQCEKEMHVILDELNELIGSEEKNRIEMETIKEQHRAARKAILAHQHSFGPAVNPLEEEWESFTPRFEEYDALIENGNYLQAREIVISLASKGDRLSHIIHEIPSLLTEIQSKIPASIRELRNGIAEMEEQSYYLGHLRLPAQFDEMEEQLLELKQRLVLLEVSEVGQEVAGLHDRIESFYDLLEEEVSSRHYVEERWDNVLDLFEEMQQIIKETIREVDFVQQSYRLDEKESQIPQNAMKKLNAIAKRIELFIERQNKHESAYSGLQTELQEIAEELDTLAEDQESFSNRIKNLRIDENQVRSRLLGLSQQLQTADRNLHRANIPGIPDEMEIQLEEADEQIFLVKQSLEEVPLNMGLVESYVQKATAVVDDVCEKTEDMIENAMLVERIIQYGNRYRASHPQVHQKLLQAEDSFMQFRYMKALEEAATAVEDVEPGAMKKIQEMLHHKV